MRSRKESGFILNVGLGASNAGYFISQLGTLIILISTVCQRSFWISDSM